MATNAIGPKVFIGSSSKGLCIAETLKDLLLPHVEVRFWKDAFHLGGTTIGTLLNELDICDYAVLVATPDDLLKISRGKRKTPRDNVIFEAGLFMGRLGSGRAFILVDYKSQIKLPSDLAGVTVATFDSTKFRINPSNALKPAVEKIVGTIKKSGISTEVDFLKSYLTFIHPNIKISDSYADILSQRLKEIQDEVRKLKEHGSWSKLLAIKTRLREYFEFSGKFEEGIEFGRAYVVALTKLGKKNEAYWSIIKNIGYMYILKAEHKLGREEIKNTIDDIITLTDIDQEERARLLFYSYRYLAISYQRDKVGTSNNMIKQTKKYLDLAEKQISVFPTNTNDYKELYARLLRNRGNLLAAEGKHKESLKKFRQSLDLFEEIEDSEHIGFSHLAIAEALIGRGNWNNGEIEAHLQEVESIFTFLGIIEGHGRVLEQYALYYFAKAEQATTGTDKEKYSEFALKHAVNSKNLFIRMKSQRLQGRLEGLEKQIKAFKMKI